MRILMIGDVCGDPGLDAVNIILPKHRDKFDFVVANGENSAASGAGCTKHSATRLFDAGVDVLTSGNHWFSSQELWNWDENLYRMLRPYNFLTHTPGIGINSFGAVTVINLAGRGLMPQPAKPFMRTADEILLDYADMIQPVILVDFHAETTFETTALAHYLDGRVTALVGTHTHVPTADARILNNSTAFVTDLGMCGAYNSVIGADKSLAIDLLNAEIPKMRHTPCSKAEDGLLQFNAVSIRTNDMGFADSIERFDFIF